MADNSIGTVSTTAAQERSRKSGMDRRRGTLEKGDQKTIKGTIVQQQTLVNAEGFPVMLVRIKFFGTTPDIRASSFDRWYGLAYPVDIIAHMFGEDLTGRQCMLRYSTINPDSGMVYIIGDKNFESDIETASTLPSFGTLFSPAGQSD